MHYKCPEPDCTEIVKEVVSVVSDNQKYDLYAVNEFEKEACITGRENKKYKIQQNHKIFLWIAKSAFYLQSLVSVERNIFDANHGKSLADGEGTLVNKCW